MVPAVAPESHPLHHISFEDANLRELDDYFAKLAEYTATALSTQRALVRHRMQERQVLSGAGQALNAFSLQLADDDIRFTDAEVKDQFEVQKRELGRRMEASGQSMDAIVTSVVVQTESEHLAVDYMHEALLFCESVRVTQPHFLAGHAKTSSSKTKRTEKDQWRNFFAKEQPARQSRHPNSAYIHRIYRC